MSIAMSTRPRLPSISTATDHKLPSLADEDSCVRSLPPLSSLLNDSATTNASSTRSSISHDLPTPGPMDHKPHSPNSLPASPTDGRRYSNDLLTHKISVQPLMKTPVRLPSFDSLKFEQQKSEMKPAFPVMQHSKSFSFSTKLSSSAPVVASAPVSATTATPAPISLPTPLSHLPISDSKQPLQLVQESPLVEKRSFAFISHSPSTFPLQEPSIDNAQLARRKRRRTSPAELAILQSEFEKGSTPNRTRRVEIAKKVNMTEKAVQIWFQNRRQTLRRQSTAEKEVHHIEPIFHHHHGSNTPVSTTAVRSPVVAPTAAVAPTPMSAASLRPEPLLYTSPKPQPINFNTAAQPLLQQQQQSMQQPRVHQASSSPIHEHPSSPIKSQPHQQSSSPSSTTPALQNLLMTPSRSPRQSKTPPGGSTLTFRLTNPKPQHQERLEAHQQVPAPSSSSTVLTPINNQQKMRQKPVMRVNNYQNKSSPIRSSGKENISPQSSPQKFSSSPSRDSRQPLKELSFNSKDKPAKSKNDEECVANLLNLRNWK